MNTSFLGRRKLFNSMVKDYYWLVKPGIIYGNAITTTAGFLLASRGHFDFGLYVAALVGISLVIASGCVFNNYIDRGIDAKMERTKNRAMVTGTIPKRSAIIYGLVLLLLGVMTLYFHTNNVALLTALIGFFVYVFLYSPLKPRTVHATLIGSIAGATPIIVGYTAVMGHFDAGAALLFIILVFWQMPHFYSIAIYRADDYAAAGIPVLPIQSGVRAAKIQMLAYIAAFTGASLALMIFGYAGYIYFVVAALLGLTWLRLCIKGFSVVNDKSPHLTESLQLAPQSTLSVRWGDKEWARKMFKLSLVVLLLLSFMMAIDYFVK